MKQFLSILCIVLLAFILCSCTAIEPDIPLDGSSHSNEPLPMPEHDASSDATETNATVPTDTSSHTTISAESTVQPTVTLPPERYAQIDNLQLFIDSTYAMMGFVDTPSDSEYTILLDCMLASAKRCFPNSKETAYRVSLEQPLQDAMMADGISIPKLSQQSFYLSQDLTVLPSKVYDENGDLSHSGERMNEFKQSYYNMYKQPQPKAAEQKSPVQWALQNMDPSPNSVAIIVSDLSEIQNGYSALNSSIQAQIFGAGKTIGIIAVRCTYSGLLPLTDGWAQWGSLPTGSLWKQLNYGDYSLGISIDPETRVAAQHPLYILCVGNSDAVNGFVNSVQNEIVHHFGEKQFEVNFRAFDIDMGTTGVNIADSVTRKDVGSLEGINYIPNGTRVSQIKLQRMLHPYSKDANPRYALYEVRYPAKSTDPRLMPTSSFQPQDFSLECKLFNVDAQGNQTPVTLSSGDTVSCIVDHIETNDAEVCVTIRIDFPYKALERGDYSLSVGMTLLPCGIISEPEWVSRYHTDTNEGEQFDGSRTVGLNGLFSSVASGQNAKTSSQFTSLGAFTLSINVMD